MAQFDVHRNPGTNKASVPYVVVVQSSAHNAHPRRVVVPLVRLSVYGEPSRPRFNPTFLIERTRVVLVPIDIASVPVDRLGPSIASLKEDDFRIIDAIDQLITQAHN